MTKKDVRDIASYLGATCLVSIEKESPYWVGKTITGVFLGRVHLYEAVKLQLRSIGSLTDEEVRECAARLDFPVIEQPDVYPILRDSASIVCAGFYVNLRTGEIDTDADDICYAAKLYAYLQSIHVYVPGTIDEQYVQLI